MSSSNLPEKSDTKMKIQNIQIINNSGNNEGDNNNMENKNLVLGNNDNLKDDSINPGIWKKKHRYV